MYTSFRSWRVFYGTFLGVDVFFVLSGFLITSLLLAEFAANGEISRKKFYIRRALRILPALFVVLIVGAGVALSVGGEGARAHYARAAFATLLFIANWVPSHLGFLSPMWSLGLEEQYYLIWPFVLIFALKRNVRPSVLAVGTAAGALVVAAMRAVIVHRAGSIARHPFAGLQGWTRADGVLVGTTLALGLASANRERIAALLRRRLLGCAAVAGAALVIFAPRIPDPWTFDSILLLDVLVAVVLGHVYLDAASPVAALLRVGPLPAIGRISYGLYIFQAPMLRIAPMMPTPARRAAVFWTGTFAMAVTSYFVVERPALRLKARLGGVRRRAPI